MYDLSALRHTQQTTKQPTVFRCPNPDCVEHRFQGYYDFESDEPICPKCGLGPPGVQKRSLTHLLVRDNRVGPIPGALGMRYYMACDPQRDFLATELNGEGASGDPAAVNCPGCMASAAYKAKHNSGIRVTPQMIREGKIPGMEVDPK